MGKKRTAAYCRVSTTSDTQDGSFEVQCEYYEKLIRENPDMEFVGVYGDHGKSGRSMRGRKELNRLIKDCEAGHVDLVLTKSISRFARNTSDCLEMVRELTGMGVNIYFENGLKFLRRCEDKYDLISIHTFEYDSAAHAYGPESKEAINAVAIEADGFDRLARAMQRFSGEHRTLMTYSPDHGQHPIAGGHGAHGSKMNEDMNIVHFFGAVT